MASSTIWIKLASSSGRLWAANEPFEIAWRNMARCGPRIAIATMIQPRASNATSAASARCELCPVAAKRKMTPAMVA
jgi:hypothetical protein